MGIWLSIIQGRPENAKPLFDDFHRKSSISLAKKIEGFLER